MTEQYEKMPNNRDSGEAESEQGAYVPQPEDFLPTPKRPPSAFEKMPRQGSALPGAIFVALMTILSILSWTDPERFGSLDVSKISPIIRAKLR